MNKTLNTLMCMICTGFLLAGCSYFDVEPVANNQNPMEGRVAESGAEDIDVMAVTNSVSAPEIDVYSLDEEPGPVLAQAPRAAQPPLRMAASEPRPVQGVLSEDPSVEVFPFDGPALAFGRDTPRINLIKPVGENAFDAPANQTVMFTTQGGGGELTKIYFAHDSASLSDADKQKLEQLGKNQPVKVTGYSSMQASYQSPVERQVANLKVSLERAFEVSKTLIENGVPAEMIETSGWGEVHPAPATQDMDSIEASRRVEITAR